MKYIIFSDIHANFEALNSFAQLIKTTDNQKLVCLGDTVGYGADPNRCVQWVRERAHLVLPGNHDHAAVGKTALAYFNPHAYLSCLWTRNKLSERNKQFLRSLPLEKQEDGIFWVHSSPWEPERWHYVCSRRDGPMNFDRFQERLCFVGHSHQPVILEQSPQGEIIDTTFSEFDLKPGHRYIINVGSLGQPRDGNPDPAFAIYDSQAEKVILQRFHYDYCPTQEKILKAGLPGYLAERLSLGK